MSSKTRNRLTILFILVLFVGPIVLAWLLASGRLGWHSQTLSNHGELLMPPVDLSPYSGLPGIAPLFKLQPSEWAIVLVENAPCAEGCGKLLNDMLMVRELLGEGSERVSVRAIVAGANLVSIHANRVQVDPQATKLLMEKLEGRASIVLVDWRHQLMMRYDRNGPLGAIHKDLKRLLRASAIR